VSRQLLRKAGLLSILIGFLFSAAAASAQTDLPPIHHPEHPKVVLVLSGGGARGAAQIGVLKVLEELHVRPDMIVGTSIGSIIGGLYAAGWSPEQIEKLLKETDLQQTFIDQIPRTDKSFRRRQDDAVFLIPTRLRFKGIVPYIPSSVLGGQRLDLFLKALEIQSTGVSDFDDLPIPYRAVAVNLTDGRAVVLDHGSLATAMRASMGIAGVFAPVELNGMKLVDGGTAANLPIGIAQDQGAQSIIAVDITSPLATPEELGSVFSIVGQLTGFLTVFNRLDDIKKLKPGDVLISPELGDLNFYDFKHAADGIAAGEVAARAKSDELKRFAVSDQEWAAFQEKHHTWAPEQSTVNQIKIDNHSWVDDRIILDKLPPPTGKPLDGPEFQRSIMKLYGLDYFGTIEPEFQRADDQGELTLHVSKKPYGRNSVQFNIGFQNDFKGDTAHHFAMRHLALALNRLGGEWVNIAQFGSTSLFSSSFYQPLEYSMHWFAEPLVSTRRGPVTLRNNEGDAQAEYRVGLQIGEMDFGRVIDGWGEVRLGPFWSQEEGDLHVGTQEILPDYTIKSGGLRATFRVDTLNESVFPTKGLEILATGTDSSATMGADAPLRQAFISASTAFTFRRNTIIPLVQAGWTPEGIATLGTSFYLGGPGKLSGLFPQQLRGDKMGFARLAIYRELTKVNLGALSTGVYAGVSLEAGNVYGESDSVSLDTLRHGGSVYLGAKTPIGPIFIGYGLADGGDHLFFLLIGERF